MSANHSTESVANEIEETPVVETEVTPDLETFTPEEYDEIIYNKEAVKIPVSERQTYLQKGYNYDKLKGELDTTKEQAQHLERVAKFYGYDDHNDFLQAFEEAEQSRQIEQEAAKLGVDEEVIRNHLQPLNQKLQTYETKVKEMEQQESIRKIEHEMQTLEGKYDDFKDYKDRVIQAAIEKGYKLEDAYILVTHQDKLANIGKETEQQVLARITGRDEKQVLPSSDRAGDVQFDPSKMSLKEIEEVSARVQRGEKITF